MNVDIAYQKHRGFIADAAHFKELIELGPSMMKGYDEQKDEEAMRTNVRLAALRRREALGMGCPVSAMPWPSYLPSYEESLAEGRVRKVFLDAQ